MYSVQECLGCDRRYKDMPGFRGSGKGAALAFYSYNKDAGHPGYCTQFCASMHGNYWDPVESDWEQQNEAEPANEALD